MKKILVIIVLLLSVFTASAQKTAREIRQGFNKGCFYIHVAEGSYAMFAFDDYKSQIDKLVYDAHGNLLSARFYLMENSDAQRSGAEWFKEKMATEVGRAVLFNFFYDTLGLLVDVDNFCINADGKAVVTIYKDVYN